MTIQYDDMTPQLAAAGLITTEVAAEILGCSEKYLRLRIARTVRPIKAGSAIFWRRNDIEEYKANHPRLGLNRRAA